jgi:hypothetical protein
MHTVPQLQEPFVKKVLLLNILICSLFFFLPADTSAKDIPMEVGGFILGSDVTDYPNIEYSNFLKEVVVYDWNGFDKGIISYGVCDAPGQIVRIKLKYKDPSKKFFNKLLDMYKEKYGKPDTWKGDSFGILRVWKWKFTTADGKSIHLILQHNTKNPNENIGNMVKLYSPDQIIREQECFTKQCSAKQCNTKQCSSHVNELDKKQEKTAPQLDWNYLIPQTQK